MEYSLNVGAWNSVFAVPSGVVDDYIKLAGGSSLKVLLYLLRHGGSTVTSERLKADIGIEDDGELEDAVLFWVQRGIIRSETDNSRTSLSADNAENSSASTVPEPISESKPAKIAAAKSPTYSNGEIAQSIKDSPGMKMLFEEAEKLYSRTLKNSERQMIMNLAEYYKLPCEVSLMLLQYCFKIDKTGTAYISKVAEDWANSEITTVQLADERIRALEKLDNSEKRLCEEMGLKSRLSANMREYIRIWTLDWNFDAEMIMLAYNKTIDTTGGWSFAYANTILERWNKAGISTVAAAEKDAEEFKKSKGFVKPAAGKRPAKTNTAKSSSFDTDKLREQIMKNYKK